MRKILALFIINVINYSTSDDQFMFNYFQEKNVNQLISFPCKLNDKDNADSIKFSNNLGIYVSMHEHQSSLFALKSSLRNRYWKLGVYVETDCRNASFVKKVFEESAALEIYGEMFKWLVIGSDVDATSKLLKDTTFSILTDLTIAVPMNNDFMLYEVYNIAAYKGQVMKVKLYGTWRDVLERNLILTKNFVRLRGNLGKMVLKAGAMVNNRPANQSVPEYLTSKSIYEMDTLSKMHYSLLIHLTDVYNFTLYVDEYTKWDIKSDPNSPVVKNLWERNIDLSGMSLVLSLQRMEFVDYLYPLVPYRSFFILLSSNSDHVKINAITKPLSYECWISILIVSLASLLVLAILLKYENSRDCVHRYSTSFIIVSGSLCLQGSSLLVNTTAVRIAFFQIMIFSFLVYNYFSANIVSIKLNEPNIKMQDSLAVLSESGFKCKAEPSMFFEYFLARNETNTNAFRQNYWLKLPPWKRSILFDEGMKKVMEGNFAYHTWPEKAYPYVERFFDYRQICSLTEVHLQSPTKAYFTIRKHSPFKEMMKIGLVKMGERGLVQKQRKKWIARVPECHREVQSINSVEIFDVFSCYIFFFCGLMLSVLVFFMETFLHKRNEILSQEASFQPKKQFLKSGKSQEIVGVEWQSKINQKKK